MSSEPASAASAPWRGYGWPVLVVALLGGHVVVVIGALVLSSTLIPGASIAPAGYAEAMAWDELQAARRASDRLGWTLEVVPSNESSLNGESRVDFLLSDALGNLIEDAELSVAMYHHSRPDKTVEARLASGPYSVTVPRQREGTWRVEAVAERDADRFLVEADIWVARVGSVPR